MSKVKFVEDHLDRIEFLLTQSMLGVHWLYENNDIAKVLQTPTEDLDFFNSDNIDKIQSLFAELIQKDSLKEKKEFIKRLDEKNYEILLRTYFHILDSTMMTATKSKH